MPDLRRNVRDAFAAGALSIALPMGIAAAAELPDAHEYSQVERGRYLVTLGDCAACHTDPRREGPFAGGRRIETPFGYVAAANITPDRKTGIGSWSDEEFDTAVRRGVMPDGKRLYPAMPFVYFAKMTSEDVLSIRAYLKTVAPVERSVQSDQLPFPFKIRALLRLWDALYFNARGFTPDAVKPAAWNRGAYLVEGPGHCAACHTPKTYLGGDKQDQKLRGYSIQGWFAPDITNDEARGLGNWSLDDVSDYLKKGHNRFEGAAGPMAEEITNSSSKMRDADLNAIAIYLKGQPGQSASQKPPAAGADVMRAGAAIYTDRCSACHKADGTGVAYLIPDLAGSTSAASRELTTMLRVVIRGAQSVATRDEPTGPAMPAFGWQLSDVQVAAVTTYIRNSWGHAAPAVTAAEARNARTSLTKALD
jgi:mono/diheme cytochrome c family protein